MSLFDIFSSSEETKKRSHLKNLISVAMADGHMDDREAQALLHVARRLGMEESEVRDIIANHAKIEFNMPELHKDRVGLLWDYICLILADGKIEETELALCEKFALRLKLRPAVVTSLLRKFREWGASKETSLDFFKKEFLLLVGDINSFEDR